MDAHRIRFIPTLKGFIDTNVLLLLPDKAHSLF